MHILSLTLTLPFTDTDIVLHWHWHCPSWISRRKKMTGEYILWPISKEECWWTMQGSIPRAPDHQSNGHSTESPRPNWVCKKTFFIAPWKHVIWKLTGIASFSWRNKKNIDENRSYAQSLELPWTTYGVFDDNFRICLFYSAIET